MSMKFILIWSSTFCSTSALLNWVVKSRKGSTKPHETARKEVLIRVTSRDFHGSLFCLLTTLSATCRGWISIENVSDSIYVPVRKTCGDNFCAGGPQRSLRDGVRHREGPHA